ncbi:LLM class flavin-dependent oxidoreductase [Cohnella sp. GCM10027633]|uniref:LLM class flavin-dependent oxidoreductase n=1 Tax=unclassified Cohnella TaxID=2636738 RepID=UPI00362CC33E
MSDHDQKVEFGWFIPTFGDGKYLGVPPQRKADLAFIIELAQTVEQAGFEFTLIPTGVDVWPVASAIISHTKKLKPLAALRPGLIEPVQAARMAASLDYLSEGRARINIVSGSHEEDLLALGDPLAHDHDGRYERADEFLHIVKSVWAQSKDFPNIKEKMYFEGKYYRINGGVSYPAPVQDHPPLYFGGSSPAGKRVASKYADVYLMWAEPLAMIKEQIDDLEKLRREYEETSGEPRKIDYGLRAQVLVRDTEEEAWEAAWEIISKVDPGVAEASRAALNNIKTTNQSRQNEIFESAKDNDYIVGPNLWAGISLVRSGGALMFVGTPDQVTDRLLEYVDLGISSFVLSSYPHLEEAKIFGEKAIGLFYEKYEKRKQQLEVVQS